MIEQLTINQYTDTIQCWILFTMCSATLPNTNIYRYSNKISSFLIQMYEMIQANPQFIIGEAIFQF